MTSFAWGADAPIFTERDLRRLARQLRLALATLMDDPSTSTPTRGERRVGDSDKAETADPLSDRADRPERREKARPGGPGPHHHHDSCFGFADEATREAAREAWRERRQAWRTAMAACESARADEDPWARSDEARGTAPRGERGGKGRHRQRREDADELGGFGGPPGRPFPPFGPFGPGPGGPGRGFRGRGPGWRFEGGRGRAGRGDVRLAILALLSEGPRHGYQLIQDITERSGGAWAPSPGSIYPALSALQDEGLIDDEKLEGRRVFSLTDAGRSYVAQRQEQVDAVFAQNSPGTEHEALAEVAALMWGVGEAALTVLGTGTEAQRAEARDLLARTRRDLFRILAEDTVRPTDTGAPVTTERDEPEARAEAAQPEEPGDVADAPRASAGPDDDPAI